MTVPTMTKHQPEAKRRDQILEAARKLFVERGYVATKMSDIAELAGLSKGGVYFHFVSKEEVFAALVEDEFQRSMGIIQKMSEQQELDANFFPTVTRHGIPISSASLNFTPGRSSRSSSSASTPASSSSAQSLSADAFTAALLW